MRSNKMMKLEEDVSRICQQEDAILKKPGEVNK